MTDKPTHPMPVLYWFGKRWWHQADGTPANFDPVRDPAERTEAGSGGTARNGAKPALGTTCLSRGGKNGTCPPAWQPLPAAPEEERDELEDLFMSFQRCR